MDTMDLVSYLTSKGVTTYRAAGLEITAHCWLCSDGDAKGKGKLYLNTESWLWDCKRCEARGNRRTLLESFGDTDTLAYLPGQDLTARRRIMEETAALAHEMLLANDKQLNYLIERGLSAETIVSAQLGYVPQNVGISKMLPSVNAETVVAADVIGAGVRTAQGYEFFNDSIIIPYLSHSHVVQLREKNLDGKYRTTANENVRLYGADDLHGADEAVVTEGEFDRLILRQHLRTSGNARLMRMAVVGLPGAGSWPEGLERFFTDVKKVYVALDPDDTGREYAAKLKKIIGTKGRVVELPRGTPKTDWSEYLCDSSANHPHGGHTWHDVAELLHEADMHGKRLFDVADAQLKWERARVEKPGLKLGFVTLDAVISPGLKPGQVFIPLAKTGTGKSAFLANLTYNLREHRQLFVSCELTTVELYEQLQRIHYFHNPTTFRDSMVGDFHDLRIMDENRVRDLPQVIEEYAEDVGAVPEVVHVDYLGYYARSFKGDRYERVSEAVMELKGIAKEFDTSIISPHQVNRGAEDGKPLEMDDARDSGVIEETGDFVVSLYRPDLAVKQAAGGLEDSLSGSFNMQLLKSRHGGRGRVFNLRFSNLSLAIVDATDRKATIRIEQENVLYRRGTLYADYRRTMSAEQTVLRLA